MYPRASGRAQLSGRSTSAGSRCSFPGYELRPATRYAVSGSYGRECAIGELSAQYFPFGYHEVPPEIKVNRLAVLIFRRRGRLVSEWGGFGFLRDYGMAKTSGSNGARIHLDAHCQRVHTYCRRVLLSNCRRVRLSKKG